ncbi:MAG: FmdC precursor [Bacteroidota bacterium]
MKIYNYFIVVLIFITSSLSAQVNYDGAGIGKGIRFKTNDDSFYLKFRTRIQTRWDFEQTPELNLLENKAFVKRSRIKFDGYFMNKDLRYKMEYDVLGGYVRDALIKYRMGNFDFWFGQGKLPGNRERIVSSANLQLVDRSIFNKNYTLDRDIGFQLHHSFNIGNVVVRDIYAITSGKGILDNRMSSGLSYTAKLEVLPFGKFTNKGDYISGDLVREETPKLSVAVYGNYIEEAYKDRGQIGKRYTSTADLLNLGFDMLFKYNGYSLMVEGGQRTGDGDAEFVYDLDQNIGAFYTGKGVNIQTGYLFKNNWEVAGRYSFTDPNNSDFHYGINDHTIGISKYIIGHAFKLQSDFTYRTMDGIDIVGSEKDMFIFRMQLEFQI